MPSATVLKHSCNMQVVAEVFAAQDVAVRPYILLSLVLYKIADPNQVHYNPADMCIVRELPLLCQTAASIQDQT